MIAPSPPPPPTPTAEPGYLTTEFAITVITQLLSLLVAFNLVHITDAQHQQVLGFLGLVLPAVGYAISRGIRKVGAQ